MKPLFWLNLLVMAGVTYLIRMVPLVVFKSKLDNERIQSFLYYIPFTVLGAMTFPEILFSTGNIWSAAVGLMVAAFLAYFEKGLVTVALSACGAVLLTECVLQYFFTA
ncbi:MAG: AzlD domain-containing protein [Clostridiales bacterium]|nr:AzlD domain-containing protein [Clostridiales bacterium]